MSSSALLLTLTLAFVPVAAADEHGAAEEEHSEGEHHDFHRNHLSFFLGVTDGREAEGGGEEDAADTLGLDYERRLTRVFGVGLLLEFVGGDQREGVVGIPVTFHAGRAAKFLLAPGVERNLEIDDYEFLVRVGFAYDFEVGRITLAPALNVDLVDGEQIYVYGVNIGWGF